MVCDRLKRADNDQLGEVIFGRGKTEQKNVVVHPLKLTIKTA